MCLNCGCGEPETRHKDTDITAEDVRTASGTTPLDQTLENIRTSLDQMATQGQAGNSAGPSQSAT